MNVSQEEVRENKSVAKNHVTTKYPGHSLLYKEAIQFYEEQLNSINEVSGEDNIEVAGRLLLLQFCVICYQDMKSIHTLLQQREFLTPLILLRHMIEFLFTWMYIEKDERERATRFIANAFKEQSKLIDDLEKYGRVDDKLLATMKDRQRENDTLYEQIVTNGGSLPSLRDRAREVGQLEMYDLIYRLLSKDSHPSSFNTGQFMTDLPDGRIKVHPYNRDRTAVALEQGLKILNSLMAVLNRLFDLPQETKYRDLDVAIDTLSSGN